jgi:multidrug efflux pump subunit AcrA (membrane-fusion protein)
MPKEGPIVREKPVKRPGSKRQGIMIAVIIVIMVIMMGTAYLIFRPAEDTYTLKTYSYAFVREGTVTETLQLSGTLSVEYAENILSPQPGIVTAIYPAQGDQIITGEVIAEINPENLEAALAEKELALSKKLLDKQKKERERALEIEKQEAAGQNLQDDLAAAEASLEKAQKLFEAGSLSRSDLENAENKVTQAKRSIADLDRQGETAALNYEYAMEIINMDADSLREDMRELRNEIDECTVRAPLDGKVMNVFVSGGDIVTQFGKLLRVADLSRPVVKVNVPENKIDMIYLGQEVNLVLGGTQYPGHISTVAMEAEATGDYESTVAVTAAFDAVPENIVPGSSVSAEIVVGAAEQALYLPRGAYLTTGNQLYLYRIRGSKAYRIEVDFGSVTADRAEILTGVEKDDKIIVSGYQDFITYQQINLNTSGGNRIEVKEQE